MDDFDLELKTEFINEALLNLEEAEGSFMDLESSSDLKPLLDKIFRLAHNLKGGSRAVGFGDVAEFTHHLENLVSKLQKGELKLSSAIVSTLLRSNDRLVEMLTALKSDMNAKFENADLLQEIGSRLAGQAPAPTPAPAPEIPSSTAFFSADEMQEALTAVEPLTPPPAPAEAASAPQPSAKAPAVKEKDDEVIRVNLSKIDMLNDYVGELIVLQSVIQQQALTTASPKLMASVGMMTKLSKNIQSLTMGLRMLPVKPLIQKLQRVVRDTANALDKEVNLTVVGEQMDVDKSVLDRLADPLIHILRNAVDHGLETRNGRAESGKAAAGSVQLSFFHEGNHLIVEVKDDGKGINPEIIRTKAIEKGVLSPEQTLSEKQLIHLIFHPGFSTKAEASEISGRGVGMDVVKTNVERIGGHVEVTSTVGKGSVFRLQIPLSLAVIEGLIVTSEKNRYVVPLSQVQETINLSAQRVFQSKLGIGPCFELRGTVVPIIEIEEALGARAKTEWEKLTAMIINVGDQLIALGVRDVVRAQQIVIKPLGNGIAAQKGWIGSCVLGDGLPTLILSPVDMLDGRIKNVPAGGAA